MTDDRTFVSYSRTDSQFAVKLASDLRANGASVWLDQLDITAGARWDSAIEDALRRSARVIVLLSPKAVASQNVLDEVSFALDEGKTIVPVLVEACTIPMRLRRLQYVDFTPGYDTALGRLLVTLGVDRASVSRAATPAAEPRVEPPPQAAPPPPIETPPSPEPFTHVSATPASGSNRPLLLGAGAAVLVALGVVISLSMRDPETAPPVDSSATTASVPDAESTAESTLPAAPAAAPTPQATTQPPPEEGTASKAVRMASGGGIGSMLAPLKRDDAASNADMPALLALVRELGDRTSLSTADLERLGDARFKACPFSVDKTPCMQQADASVTSLLETVCRRQASPNVSTCALNYEFAILQRQSDKAGEMLKRIKPG